MKKTWIFILIAGMAIVAMSAYHYLMRPGRGDAAPAFALSDTQGVAHELSKYKGSPVVLVLWATWCDVCQAEWPELNRFASTYASTDLKVIGISEDDSESRLKSFLKGNPAEFTVLMDPDGKVADAYMSYAVPESFIIDRNGVIVWRRAGLVDWKGKGVKKVIDSVLAGSEKLD